MSSYFRKHALSVLIAEILKLHNRDMFEIYIFSYGEAKEDTQERKRIMEYADHFINLRGTNDKDSAVLIRDLGINILFDMNGYSGNIRPGILALRPAPVQALWMSYPNTVGGPYTDYYISDRYIVETEEHAKSFTEKVKRLSRCCWTYDTESRVPDYSITRETEGLPKDAIVLGNFNGVHKMSFLTISLWMEILQKTDNTLLWTMESNHLMRPAMQELAKKYGVDPKRILPAAIVPHAKHLGRFQAVDLVLDTFPCNGHTLTMDALWAGCPVVTYAGRTPVGRVAGSALRTQGFDQLVAQSPQEYVNTAVEICKNPDLRQYIRTEMMERRYSGTLFDQKSFVRELDSIYMEIWQEAKQELNL
jgi:predicted O-linked N-acetylglucosamine transferase (SPINDLY family)